VHGSLKPPSAPSPAAGSCQQSIPVAGQADLAAAGPEQGAPIEAGPRCGWGDQLALEGTGAVERSTHDSRPLRTPGLTRFQLVGLALAVAAALTKIRALMPAAMSLGQRLTAAAAVASLSCAAAPPADLACSRGTCV
jgi:hypothetical protein